MTPGPKTATDFGRSFHEKTSSFTTSRSAAPRSTGGIDGDEPVAITARVKSMRVWSSTSIDVALVNGYGFPRAHGGPMYAADRRGLTAVLADIDEAHRVGGVGSEPAPLLVELAKSGGTLGAWRRDSSRSQE